MEQFTDLTAEQLKIKFDAIKNSLPEKDAQFLTFLMIQYNMVGEMAGKAFILKVIFKTILKLLIFGGIGFLIKASFF